MSASASRITAVFTPPKRVLAGLGSWPLEHTRVTSGPSPSQKYFPGAGLFLPLVWLFGVSPRDAVRGLRKNPSFLFQSLLEFHSAFKEALMVIEHSANHLSSLIYTLGNVARVVSQHTLLYDAESNRQPFHFFILLPQELKDVLPSLSF